MFIVSKRSVIFRDKDATFAVPAGYMGNAPDWIANIPLFGGLVREGSIVVSETVYTVDKAVENAEKITKKKTSKK